MPSRAGARVSPLTLPELVNEMRRTLRTFGDERAERRDAIFAAECERAIYEGRVQLPDDLLLLLGAKGGG